MPSNDRTPSPEAMERAKALLLVNDSDTVVARLLDEVAEARQLVKDTARIHNEALEDTQGWLKDAKAKLTAETQRAERWREKCEEQCHEIARERQRADEAERASAVYKSPQARGLIIDKQRERIAALEAERDEFKAAIELVPTVTEYVLATIGPGGRRNRSLHGDGEWVEVHLGRVQSCMRQLYELLRRAGMDEA